MADVGSARADVAAVEGGENESAMKESALSSSALSGNVPWLTALLIGHSGRREDGEAIRILYPEPHVGNCATT